MNKSLAGLVILAVLLAGCGGGATAASPTAAPTATPTPQPPQATIVEVVNDVEAHPQPEGEWEAAEEEMVIYTQGQVRANESSTARVGIESDLVRVAPNTTFTLDQPDPDTLRLNLDEGQIWINVEGLEEGETFEIETPAAIASVRGTRLSVRVNPDGTTLVSTWVNTVTVSTAAGTVDVGAGLQTTAAPDEPPSEPAPMSDEEQVRWGLAAGEELDIVLPTRGLINTLNYSYSISDPALSPGGEVFAGIYMVPLGGSSYRPEPLLYDLQASLVSTETLPGNVTHIAFNPAGQGLAYELHGQICTANSDGTDSACFGGNYYSSSWSPNGEALLFGSHDNELFTAQPDGGGLTTLVPAGSGWAGSASWSPDSSQIAYTLATNPSSPYDGPFDLWIVNADGSDPQQVFQQVGFGDPVWSPDGSLIAVSGYGESSGGGGIWYVPLDGADPWQAPGTAGWSCWNITWSPTASGWPLFFHGVGNEQAALSQDVRPVALSRGPESRRAGGLWWLTLNAALPTYFSSASWGPVWDTGVAAFGYAQGSGDAQTTRVDFYELDLNLEW